MASRQQIKRRITSIKNTKQITRAMQMVAASKLRRAQDAASGPQEYSRIARQMLTRLRQLSATEPLFHLYMKRPVKHRTIIVVSSDMSLAGAYNSNVAKRLLQEVKVDRERGAETSVICIGRQIAHTAARVRGLKVAGVYQEFPTHPTANDIRPILNAAVEQFIAKDVDEVSIIYTHFISTINQEVEMRRLLPAGFEEEPLNDEIMHATIEPSVEELLRSATVRLLEVQIFQAILESVASEQSMRMLAMKNATDNASDLIADYTLEYNNARQAAITQELAEISGGAEALK